MRSLFSVWLDKLGAVSIRTKLMGIVAVCILISAVALVWYTYHSDTAALRSQLRDRGVAVGTALAVQGRDPMLTDNQFAVYALLKNTCDADEDLIYAFALDSEGSVLAHTFDDGFPTDLAGANQVQTNEAYRVQTLRTEDDVIQDVAISVLGDRAGTIRVGLSEASIRATVADHIWSILLWTALILTVGLSVAYGLASIVTAPLVRLAEAARAVGRGDFRWKAHVWARDEVGSLGKAFNEMSEELERRDEMRMQLLAKVISAQEDERKRIARELHDETSQSLTSLMLGLKLIDDSADSPEVREKISKLRALTADTLDEVHHLALRLRPSLLDDLGLVAAIQRYAEEYSASKAIKVDTQVAGLDELRLPSEIEVAAFRIVQEALTNVARYAEARNVSVVLGRRDASLVAVIEDDGIGFDVDRIMALPNGQTLGLFGMYERTALIGGKLTIESQPGTGTSVFLEVPLPLKQEVADEQDEAASGR
jgi:signal transduction histidine kinase